MIKKITFGAIAIAMALTTTVAFGEGSGDGLGRELGINASSSLNQRRATSTREVKTASSSRPLLRGRPNASSTHPLADSICAKAAVDVRKAALTPIYKTFTDAINLALGVREDAIKASFDQTTKKTRLEARKAARSNYKKSVKGAAATFRTSERAALTVYRNSIKACGGNASEASVEDSDGNFVDAIK